MDSSTEVSHDIDDDLVSDTPPFIYSEEWDVDVPSEYAPAVVTTYQSKFTLEYAIHKHVNYIVYKEVSHGEDTAVGVLTVDVTPVDSLKSSLRSVLRSGLCYRTLYTSAEGYEENHLYFPPVRESKKVEGFEATVDSISAHLNSDLISKELRFRRVPLEQQPAFSKALKKFEAKHTRRLSNIKLAVLYVKKGQTTMEEIWKNKPPKNSRFYAFLDKIAGQIDLTTWGGFRGGMGAGADEETTCYFRKWNNIDILFHLAPCMNEEQNRRLCGNDVGVLIYYDCDDDTPFVPFGSKDMGIVPQVFSVVQEKEEGKFRLGFFQRSLVGKYLPHCPPSDHYFDIDSVQPFLYTKIYNGFMHALSCPPLNRLFTAPRSAELETIGNDFSAQTLKERLKQTKAGKGLGVGLTLTAVEPNFAGALGSQTERGPTRSSLGVSHSPRGGAVTPGRPSALMASSPGNLEITLLLVGVGGVGRTSLISRISDGTFNPSVLPSGTSLDRGYFEIEDASFTIISPPAVTADSEVFLSSVDHIEYNAIIIVTDPSIPDSLNMVAKNISQLSLEVPIDIWENKFDLGMKPLEHKWTDNYHWRTQRVSAKTGENVDEAMELLLVRIKEVLSAATPVKGKKHTLFSKLTTKSNTKSKDTKKSQKKEKRKKTKSSKGSKNDSRNDTSDDELEQDAFFTLLASGAQTRKDW